MYNTKSDAKLGKSGYRQSANNISHILRILMLYCFLSLLVLQVPIFIRNRSNLTPTEMFSAKYGTKRFIKLASDLANYPEVSSTTIQVHLAHPTIQVNSTQPDSISSGPDWYLDSEVTHHVTNDINHLSSYISL
jgi:hypothetical protein